MSPRKRAYGLVLFLAIFVLGLASSAVFAQDQPVPKVDVFAGYSWYDPGLRVNGIKLDSNPKGFGLGFTYNFNKLFGLTLDGGGHFGGDNNTSGTVMFGPRLKFRQEHFEPFIHAMTGLHLLNVRPLGGENDKGIGVKLGGGFDIPVHSRVSIRLFEADYVWAHHNYFPLTPNRNSNPSGAELRSGLVFNFGGAPPLPPMAMTCAPAQPAAVMAGEPVSVSASVTNIPPKKTLTYDWKTTGGKITGNGTAAQIDTAGLQPGQYTVTANATDPKPKKGQGPLT
jgi:hypothetical protein